MFFISRTQSAGETGHRVHKLVRRHGRVEEQVDVSEESSEEGMEAEWYEFCLGWILRAHSPHVSLLGTPSWQPARLTGDCGEVGRWI